MPGKLGFDNLQGRHPGGFSSEVWLEVWCFQNVSMFFFLRLNIMGWVFLGGFKYFLFHPLFGEGSHFD